MTPHLVAHFAHLAAAVPRGRVLQDDELLVVDSGYDCDTFNAVVSGDLVAIGAENRIERALDLFGERAFSWWHGPGAPAFIPELLDRRGLRVAERETAMRLELGDVTRALEKPAGLSIVQVTTPEDLEAYASVIAENWTPPDPAVPAFFAAASVVALQPGPLVLLLGRWEGAPVGTAELALGADGIAGLYGVATRSAWRGRGIASALTAAALREARTRGSRSVELQAAGAAESLYRRLGFKSFGVWAEFKK